MNKRYIGVVVKYFPEKGYGFVKKQSNRGENDIIFFHSSAFQPGEIINRGMTVEFAVVTNEKSGKKKAIRILTIAN